MLVSRTHPSHFSPPPSASLSLFFLPHPPTPFHLSQGVPLRIEVGPRDIESRSAMVVRRDNGKKASYPVASMNIDIPALLVGIQSDMLNRARAVRDEHTVIVTEYVSCACCCGSGT